MARCRLSACSHNEEKSTRCNKPLGLRGAPEDARALLQLFQHKKLPPASIHALGLALSYFATADSFAALLRILEDPRANTMALVGSLETLSKWRGGRPGALRKACVSFWKPLASSQIEAWARSW
jgi:hypothetical protein